MLLLFVVSIIFLFLTKDSSQYTSSPALHNGEESLDDSYSTVVILNGIGDNEGIIELTDRKPSVLWTMQKEKGNSITIKAEDGYKIAVTIIQCSLDGTKSYVKISSNADLDSDDTLLFAYEVKEHFSYLFNSNAVYLKIDANRKTSKFTANFTRFGKKTEYTTTPVPTSTIVIPTPGKNDSSELTVFIEGREASDFKQQVVYNSLKTMILGMAKEYCEDQLFPLAKNITIYNILISRLFVCPKNWHNSEKCIILRFSVPVELKEHSLSKWNGYQMNSDHLKIMWDRYSSKYLKDLWTYDSPDLNSSMKWEIVISVVFIFCFAIGLIVLRYLFVIRPEKKRQRKMSDAMSIVSSTSRTSELSLPPHYLQEAPPLFDRTYTMYDPTIDTKPFEFADFTKALGTMNKRKNSKTSDVEESGA